MYKKKNIVINALQIIFIGIFCCSFEKNAYGNQNNGKDYLNEQNTHEQINALAEEMHYRLRSSLNFQGITYYTPSFQESSICNPVDENLYLKMTQDNKFFDFVQKKYNNYILDNLEFSETPRIPKIIHQIWIGPNKPPEHFAAWRDSWLNLHPTWEYILWDEEKIAQLNLENKEFIEEEKNYGAKSDLIRYEIIYQFGGLYIDVDFECLKPFDFLHHCLDFYASFFEVSRWPTPPWLIGKQVNQPTSLNAPRQDTPRIVNGIFGARKNHPIVQELIKQAKYFRERKHILTRVGPDYFKTVVENTLPLVEGKNLILPSNYLFSWHKKDLIIMPETLAVHHYSGSWGNAYVKNLIQPFKQEELEKEMFDFIRKILPRNKTILEIGKDLTSDKLSKFYRVYTLLSEAKRNQKIGKNYLYVPTYQRWYNLDIFKEQLPKEYDLLIFSNILQDIDSEKLYEHLNLLNLNIPIIFYDTNKEPEYNLMEKVSEKLNRNYEVFYTASAKQFGVIRAK
jgi:hypothetical protein